MWKNCHGDGCCAGVIRRVTEAVSCASAAKSHDLSTVNCLIVQRLALAIVQLSVADYQLLVSFVFTVSI